MTDSAPFDVRDLVEIGTESLGLSASGLAFVMDLWLKDIMDILSLLSNKLYEDEKAAELHWGKEIG